MKFVMNRNVTIASTTGHSVVFVKGEPTYVPPAMHKEVAGQGAVPIDGEVSFEEIVIEDNTPTNADERAEMIKLVLADMKERNVSEEFTAAGSPKVKVVSGLTGFPVEAAEITDLWNALKGE